WAVQRYIVEFDGGDPIDPFEFSLTQSVQIQRAQRSPRGKALDAASDRARRATRKLVDADTDQLPLAPEERADLETVVAEAATEIATLKTEAKAAGEPLVKWAPKDVPKRTAMTERGIQRSRTSKRHY